MAETRGTYELEIDGRGHLTPGAANLEKVRKLFLDGEIIDSEWGPGNEGDFDNGSWHILCHLAGGTGAWQTANGRAWLAITHDADMDLYKATVTWRDGGVARTVPITSSDGAKLLGAGTCLGYIEGSSLGHIAARNAQDADTAFNNWPRQLFDKAIDSEEDGGTVWEHWCTTRDIRASSAMGTSVVRAWFELLCVLGGRYVAAVARGRGAHGHPRQLAALVKAGLLSAADATWETNPIAIPEKQQALLYEARPAEALAAVEGLAFHAGHEHYFMFERRIGEWRQASDVRADLAQYP